eukprot:SAG22_NODE_314_length_12607_cov_177.638311_7_plen_389_part_00
MADLSGPHAGKRLHRLASHLGHAGRPGGPEAPASSPRAESRAAGGTHPSACPVLLPPCPRLARPPHQPCLPRLRAAPLLGPVPLTASSPYYLSLVRCPLKKRYVELGVVLSPEEVQVYEAMMDTDRQMWAHEVWHTAGNQVINCDGLVTVPVFDALVRHKNILPAVEQLMGPSGVCFSEMCLRYMDPNENPETALSEGEGWHADTRELFDEHPLKMDYIQLMLYFTDVGPDTHCFSVSPSSVSDPALTRATPDWKAEHLAWRKTQCGEPLGGRDLHGKAGSAVLFNVSCLHAAHAKPTRQTRKTAQVYYGHPNRPYLSDDSLVPASLWREHPDPEVRRFYSVFNRRTRLYNAALGGPDVEVPNIKTAEDVEQREAKMAGLERTLQLLK